MARLQEHREKLNLTQKELSNISGISIRTIQRIESGVPPKGYTLKTLAKTLAINENDLLEEKEVTEQIDYTLLNIINLSSLLVSFIPIINFLTPLTIAILKKQYNLQTKQIINIQVLWTILFLVILALGTFINAGNLIRDFFIAILFLLILANLFIILRNSIEINKNNKLYFSLKIRIL
ncbi:helix-turn-helix domain-containing protein [Aquimarina sp. TRL1]|uniref:helix-turn-helix domain-containing protein n=1 Tax=Aquimarina sp. (strain TRL1) TaxID=2736252 RepID=UPI00158C7B5E|nr:helix-turn-helix domain-containing protein [Aquimarina sp. TRL1]QKX06084.1 helix-turn-helix domain-containing protein [Aquimarina sp. TRL1]